jgi:hypothetical protein
MFYLVILVKLMVKNHFQVLHFQKIIQNYLELQISAVLITLEQFFQLIAMELIIQYYILFNQLQMEQVLLVF